MVVSAGTAPKSGGVDDVLTAVVFWGRDRSLGGGYEKLADERKNERWGQQAQEVRSAEVIVLIGVQGTKQSLAIAGRAATGSCDSFEKAEKKLGQDFEGPTCIFKALDLGIACVPP